MANQRLIYGFHAVNARLWQNPKSITELYVQEGKTMPARVTCWRKRQTKTCAYISPTPTASTPSAKARGIRAWSGLSTLPKPRPPRRRIGKPERTAAIVDTRRHHRPAQPRARACVPPTQWAYTPSSRRKTKCGAERHRQQSRLRRGGNRPLHHRNQPRPHPARAERIRHLDHRHRHGRRFRPLPLRPARQRGMGDGQRRRRHAPPDARTLRHAGVDTHVRHGRKHERLRQRGHGVERNAPSTGVESRKIELRFVKKTSSENRKFGFQTTFYSDAILFTRPFHRLCVDSFSTDPPSGQSVRFRRLKVAGQ